jgi:hypothetical protein
MKPVNDQSSKRRDLMLALGAFAVALVLWQFQPLTPIVYPLRLFVTFIHELGHGVAAEVTGGEFLKFEVDSSGAGVAFTRGGMRPAIISAGYVGTAIFGAVLLFVTNRTTRAREVAIGLGAAFIVLTLIYSGLGLSQFNAVEVLLVLAAIAGTGFVLLVQKRLWLVIIPALITLGLLLVFAAGGNFLTLLVGVLSGILLMLLGYFAKLDVTRFVLNFLAFAVGFNAISDAWVLLQIVSNPNLVSGNDAVSRAEEAGGQAAFWAMVWIFLALFLQSLSMYISLVRLARKSTVTPPPNVSIPTDG